MKGSGGLSIEERTFFSLLTETVYANPFGSDPDRLERLLGAEASDGLTSQADYYIRLIPALEGRIRALQERGLTRIERFRAEDRELMRQVLLFYCYQRHFSAFDALIEAQVEGGAQSPGLPAGEEILAELRSYGFDAAEANRFVALFYQLRRAYYFIERALVGCSRPMRELRSALWNSVFTRDLRSYALLLWERMEDFSTLLLGETGTGKGSAALAIGRCGPIPFDPRSGRFVQELREIFIGTNLSQFPESLIESELFGHRKGAFTGAVDSHEGIFGRCRANGALFLDEIGDLSPPVQTKLLRVLQERSFAPVGSHKEQRFEGRIIAATNCTLDELLAAGRFRRDFFYRLSSNIIQVPPLRERLEDDPRELGELVDVLLARVVDEAGGSLRESVMEALDVLPAGYPWPGNVRELEQALRRIILNGRYVPDPLPGQAGEDPWLADVRDGRHDAAGLLAGYCRRLYDRLGTYEAVARVTGLDRRTAKRHIETGR
jgi:sigma-54 dependent transcriptional regulator, flagellar regulatory protein